MTENREGQLPWRDRRELKSGDAISLCELSLLCPWLFLLTSSDSLFATSWLISHADEISWHGSTKSEQLRFHDLFEYLSRIRWSREWILRWINIRWPAMWSDCLPRSHFGSSTLGTYTTTAGGSADIQRMWFSAPTMTELRAKSKDNVAQFQ
jgi:hypothetical protein